MPGLMSRTEHANRVPWLNRLEVAPRLHDNADGDVLRIRDNKAHDENYDDAAPVGPGHRASTNERATNVACNPTRGLKIDESCCDHVPMALQLRIEFESVDGAPALRQGWRGLIDFGERWTEDDAELWPEVSGAVPVGEPLVYGCELRLLASPSEGPASNTEAVLQVWSLEARRSVMRQGVALRLLDGKNVRATGELL
jgi:hypothetical protein